MGNNRTIADDHWGSLQPVDSTLSSLPFCSDRAAALRQRDACRKGIWGFSGARQHAKQSLVLTCFTFIFSTLFQEIHNSIYILQVETEVWLSSTERKCGVVVRTVSEA